MSNYASCTLSEGGGWSEKNSKFSIHVKLMTKKVSSVQFILFHLKFTTYNLGGIAKQTNLSYELYGELLRRGTLSKYLDNE